MFTEQEQLDELYDIIAHCPGTCDGSKWMEQMSCNECSAKSVYGANYRKLADDEMIILKEDYELLKKIEKAFDPLWFCTFGGCEGARKECKNTCEMSIFVKERKQILDDLHNEFSRYKCYEHADKYLREYATKRGIKLEEQCYE